MKMSLGGRSLIAGAAICLAFFLPQVPGCVMANSAKEGRVVDAQSGSGVAGVYVIATATFAANALVHGSSHGYLYRTITRTDADGYYSLPSTWTGLRFALPWLDPTERWMVTAYAPGYVVEGDETSLDKFDQFGLPAHFPRSVITVPPARWLVTFVEVSPIRLVKVPMSEKQAIYYFREVASLGLNAGDDSSPNEVALRKVGYDTFMPSVCGRDPASTMDSFEGTAYGSAAHDGIKFTLALRRLEPSGWDDPYRHPVFHAGNVCKALRIGETR